MKDIRTLYHADREASSLCSNQKIEVELKQLRVVSGLFTVRGRIGSDSELDSVSVVLGDTVHGLTEYSRTTRRFSSLVNAIGLRDGEYALSVDVMAAGQKMRSLLRVKVRNSVLGLRDCNEARVIDNVTRPTELVSNYPFRIFIEPTKACNLHCRICRTPEIATAMKNQWFFRNLDIGAFNHLEEVIRYAKFVLFAGCGEPTLHPDLSYMMRKVREWNDETYIGLITNFTLVDRQRVIELMKSGLTNMIVSVDSPEPEKYEEMRAGANYERLVHGLEVLKETKQELGVGLPELSIGFVVTKLNIMDIHKIVLFAHRFGASTVIFKTMMDSAEENFYALPEKFADWYKSIIPSRQDFLEYGELWLKTEAEAWSHSISIWGSGCRKFREALGVAPEKFYRTVCPMPYNTMLINSNGDLLACCGMLNPIGNLKEKNGSLLSIYNNVNFRKLRRDWISNNLPDPCRKCIARSEVQVYSD